MARIKPFGAVRYDERRAGPLGRLVAPPFDVISSPERDRYRALSPHNVVHLTLPDSAREAGRLWADWQDEGVLVREQGEALWWLREDYEGPDGVTRAREGFVAAVGVEPYERGVIRPHERTYAETRGSQLELLRAVRASLSPIFLLYDDPAGNARRLLVPHATGTPELDATHADSRTRLWRVTDSKTATAVAASLSAAQLVIADGHHRYETALAFHEEDGTEASGYTMAVLTNIQGEGLTIFPTHRVLRRLPELDNGYRQTRVEGGPEEALRRLESVSREYPAFVLYRPGAASLVEAPEQTSLDAVAFDRLGAESVRYTPRAEEAVALVDSGEGEAAVLLRAPTIDQVAAVAERGEVMPQKSTYFYPKLLSGLLFHPLT